MKLLLPTIALPLAFSLSWLANRIGLRAFLRLTDAHWTERARVLFPALLSEHYNRWALAAGLGLGQALVEPGWALPLTTAGLGWIGSLLGGYPLSRAMFPGVTIGEWAADLALGWGLRLVPWGLYGAAAWCMPHEAGWPMAAVALGALSTVAALQLGLWLRLLRVAGILRPAGQRLRELVATRAARHGHTVRAVWELPSRMANAFAFALSQQLAFTTGFIEAAPDEEVAAVCDHELAHLHESRAVVALRTLVSLQYLPLIFLRPVYALASVPGVYALYLGGVLIGLLGRRLAHRMEVAADRFAVAEGEQSAAYAAALERIHRINLAPAVLPAPKRQTHPQLYDRLIAAGITPDYARPEPPDGAHWTTAVFVMSAAVVLMVFFATRPF